MAIALRPCDSANSMASRYGSQVLGDEVRDGRLGSSEACSDTCSRLGNSAESVVTCMAGFAGSESASGPKKPGFRASKSVVTSMAGFAVDGHPVGRKVMPAARKYPLAVSRRTPVSCWIRRRDQPSFPKAITCCFLSSFKTLAILTEATELPASVNVLDGFYMAGFQGDPTWPVLGDPRGPDSPGKRTCK